MKKGIPGKVGKVGNGRNGRNVVTGGFVAEGV